MSKPFAIYRAPPRPTPQTTLPAPLRRHLHRLSRRLRPVLHRPYARLAPPLLLLVLALLALRLLLHPPSTPRRTRGRLAVRPTACACPLPATSARFARHVLSHAAFVARVSVRADLSRPGADLAFFAVDELFRGPLRAPQFALVARDPDLTACFEGGLHPPVEEHPHAWLVVAAGIDRWPDPGAVGRRPRNYSLLLPGPLAGAGCPHPAVRGDGPVHADGMVWMAPWSLLTREVVDGIREDAGEGDLWWRRRHAWLEFEGAVRRAAEVGTPGSVKVRGPRKRGVRLVREAVERVGGRAAADGGEWWLEEGVTLIAACKDRTSTLGKAVRSWSKVRGVHEVLLVDWSSDPPVSYFGGEDGNGDGGRFTLVRVVGQSDWVLSRAYNLAARLASYSKLLKVDCDTFLQPDFVEAHPLRRHQFYAGDWRQLDSAVSEDLHVNGLLYVHRDDFLAVGGYDERITTYGWDDSDIAQRLAAIRNFSQFDYTKVSHISHSASLRVVNQRTTSLLPPENPHAAAVEIQRNRLLLTRFHIPVWTSHSLHTLWNVQPIASNKNGLYFQGTKGPGRVFEVKAANEVTAVSSLVSDADALDVAKRAVRLILHRYGVQFLPKSLTLDFYKELITKVAFPEHYAEVVLTFRGGCASRLLAYATSNQAATGARLTTTSSEIADSTYVWPPLPYRGWRLQGLWQYPNTECSCKFSAVFDAREEEIIATWSDTANPMRPSVPIADRQPSVDVISILKGFDARATEKIISQDLLKWTKKSKRHSKHDKPRILMDDLACDVDPGQVAEHRRQLMQAQLRRLAPTKEIQETVSTSLHNPSPTVLDSPLLAKENWSILVGHKYATTVRDMFTRKNLQVMAAAWGAAALQTTTPFHRLDHRAAALTIAAYVSQHGVSSPSHLTPLQSEQLNQTVTTLSRRIERLFIGCLSQPSTYLEAYPELSLILAGFLSCGTCV